MKALIIAAVAAVLSASVALAEDAPIKRTPIQKTDFPEGHSTILVLVEIAAGKSAGRHVHPGVETGYVLEGEVRMAIEGEPEKTLKAGDSYLIPAGKPHDVTAIGSGPGKALATFVVDSGKPMAEPAK